jgi:hypothetical protein
MHAQLMNKQDTDCSAAAVAAAAHSQAAVSLWSVTDSTAAAGIVSRVTASSNTGTSSTGSSSTGDSCSGGSCSVQQLLPKRVYLRSKCVKRCRADVAAGRPGIMIKPEVRT